MTFHVSPPRNPVIKALVKLQKEEAKAARRKAKPVDAEPPLKRAAGKKKGKRA